MSAYAFMVFVLLYIPCVIAAVAMVHEFGAWKWYGIAFAYQMVLAWLMALIVFQGGAAPGIGRHFSSSIGPSGGRRGTATAAAASRAGKGDEGSA